jgi:hypothetical protein
MPTKWQISWPNWDVNQFPAGVVKKGLGTGLSETTGNTGIPYVDSDIQRHSYRSCWAWAETSCRALPPKQTPLTAPGVNGAQRTNTQPHISCVTEAVAYLIFCHMGHYFMEPADCHDAPKGTALVFIRSVGLTRICKNGRHNRSYRSHCNPRPPFEHKYNTDTNKTPLTSRQFSHMNVPITTFRLP